MSADQVTRPTVATNSVTDWEWSINATWNGREITRTELGNVL